MPSNSRISAVEGDGTFNGGQVRPVAPARRYQHYRELPDRPVESRLAGKAADDRVSAPQPLQAVRRQLAGQNLHLGQRGLTLDLSNYPVDVGNPVDQPGGQLVQVLRRRGEPLQGEHRPVAPGVALHPDGMNRDYPTLINPPERFGRGGAQASYG